MATLSVERYSPPLRKVSLPPSTNDSSPLKRAHLLYGDFLRVAGSVAVVALHVAGPITRNRRVLGSSQWWFAALFDGAGRWAVPAFLMLSGALFLDPSRGESPSAFYRNRLKRLGPILLFWSLFYLVWGRLLGHEPRTFLSAAHDLLIGEPYYHLHFLFALPVLYFFTPMLRVYIRHAPVGQLRLLTAAVVGLTLLSGFFHELWDRGSAESLNAFSRFSPFLGFFLVGYHLRDVTLSRQGRLCVLSGFIATVLLYAAGTAWLAPRYPGRPFAFYFLSQYSLTRLTGGVCMFLLLASLFHRGIGSPALGRLVTRLLAPASLGVYLIHPIFIDLLRVSKYSLLAAPTWVTLPLATIGVWLASVTVTLALRRLPLLHRLMG